MKKGKGKDQVVVKDRFTMKEFGRDRLLHQTHPRSMAGSMRNNPWHSKADRPVYSPNRASNRIIFTSILLGWHLNMFTGFVDEDGKVYTDGVLNKKGQRRLDWEHTIIQRWAYIVDILPIFEMADEREIEWKNIAAEIEKRLACENGYEELPF